MSALKKRATTTRPAQPLRTYEHLYPPRNSQAPTPIVNNRRPSYRPVSASRQARPYRRSTAQELPAPESWAKVLAAAVLDARAGRRDPRSLQRWLLPRLTPLLAPMDQVPTSSSLPAVARSAHAQQVAPGVFEVAVVLVEKGRACAVALRMREHRGRWLTTELELA